MTDAWKSAATPLGETPAAPTDQTGWRAAATPVGGGEKPSDEIEHTWLSTVDDTLKSVGSGALQGIAGTFGMLGWAEKGLNWVTELGAGFTPEQKAQIDKSRLFATPGELLQDVGYTGYEPKSTATKYLQTISEFTAGALGGDVGALRSVATRVPGAIPALMKSAAKWGLVPGAASETAGELTKGSPLEDAARIAGGLLGARVSATALNKTAPVAAKSLEELGNLADLRREEAYNAGVMIRPESVRQSMTDMAVKLKNRNIDDVLHGDAFHITTKILKDTYPQMARPSEMSQATQMPKSLRDLETYRQWAREVTKSTDPRNVPFGMEMIDHIDDYMDEIMANPAKHLVSGDPKAIQALKEYRRYYHLKKKGQEVADMIERAGGKAKSRYVTADFRTALSHQADNLRNRKNFKKLWTPEEQKQIKLIAEGDAVQNTLKFVGKVALRGILSFIGGLEMAHQAGWMATAGMWGTGETARFIANRMARKAAADLETLAKGGRPAIRRPLPPAAVLGTGGGLAGGPLLDQQPMLSGATPLQ